MSVVSNDGAGFVQHLLALPTLQERSAFLLTAGQFNENGLTGLLDAATHLLHTDPRKGLEVAVLCAKIAEEAQAPAITPRALYLCAQAHAIKAEFDTSLELIESAQHLYLSLGMQLEALRCNIGRMNVLGELGRYQEALDTGQMVLSALPANTHQSAEVAMLTALAYQSQGLWYEQIGHYDDALSVYTHAEEHYRPLGAPEQLGAVSNNRGIVLLRLGRGSAALTAFEAAAALFAEANLTLLHAQTLINIGDAHLLLGNYTRSLAAFEQARHLLIDRDALAEEPVLLLDTADAYLALNLFPEALHAYQEAESLLRAVGNPHDLARALWGLGTTQIARFQFDAAGSALDEAASLFRSAANLPMLVGVILEQASLSVLYHDRETGLKIAQDALRLIEGHDWPVQHAYTHLRIADILLPDLAAAEYYLLEADRVAETLGLAQLTYRVQQRLGHVRRHQGRNSEAREYLESAIALIEQLRGTLAFEGVRASFLHDKTAAYDDLIQLHLASGNEDNIWQAFATTERARSRALVDLLARVDVAEAPVSVDTPSARQMHALQADLTAIYNELLGGTRNSQSETPLPELRVRATELEHELSALRLQAASATSSADPLNVPWSPGMLQAQLPTNAVVLTYYILDSEIIAFVSAGDIRIARTLSTLPVVQRLVQRLTAQWDRFRAGQLFVRQHHVQLELSARRILTDLYNELIAPIESLFGEPAITSDSPVRKLVIVPFGALHQVPFHALYDGQGYLIERFEISYAPSATVFVMCQQRQRNQIGPSLVIGVADEYIPAVDSEVAVVTRHLSGATLLQNEQATLAALHTAAQGCSILHMACHGLFRVDNPLFSSLKLFDGWLLATDIMRLELTGAIVVLSACESGRGQVLGGDEIIGLTRVFLGAGATTLIVSLWLVQDETTAQLMDTLYAQLNATIGCAAALRTAQLEIKARYPHPYYWAPFVLVGQR